MSIRAEMLPGSQSLVERRRKRHQRANGFVISMFACAVVIGVLFFYSDALAHWFLIPVFLCGVLIGRDAVDWVRGRLDAYDPIGIIGLLGVHFFFLAPLLHVIWDYWMGYIVQPPDWRDWLGGMAVLNLFGLAVYRSVVHNNGKGAARTSAARTWVVHTKRWPVVIVSALIVTGALQFWVYARFGGLLGYIESYVARENAFEGMGWLFMLSESFPIVAMMGLATLARTRPVLRSWPIICLALVVFLGAQMLFGGLRGSRSNTIWALFWAVGIIHLVVRAVPRKLIYAGLGFVILFMYVYGFYKAAGFEVLAAIRSPEVRADLEERSGRTLEAALLGDLGRSDVQAYVLYKLWPASADYEYAWGRTYVGAAVLLVPRALWPNRPPTKVKEGTEALYGVGSYAPGAFESSQVYGVTGEGMLNFGPFAVPFVFLLLGLVVRRVRRWHASLTPGDTRLMLYPMLVNLCFIILTSDSDNLVFFVAKHATVPFLLTWVISRTTARRQKPMGEVGALRHTLLTGA